jgi:UDP-glucose 4-epimerase
MIIVTGGTGYIGSHTTVELLEKGYDVLIIDNLSNSKKEVIDNIEKITGKRPLFEQIDLTNKNKTFDVLGKYSNLEAIIHFAAYKAVGESVDNPLKYYGNNLISLMNILEGMKKFNIPNIVFSSSCTVYGEPDKLPVDENAPIKKASSPYGNTKQISEEIIFDSINAYKGIKGIALRYFNPIGAHESALIGELPLGVPDNLVPYITQTAIGIREQLKVFGSDYNTSDGTCIRDYIHVVDLAKAHIVAIERLISNENLSDFEIFNLGTGRGNTVLEVLHTFEEANNLKLNYRITDRRAGDIEKVFADPTIANNVLKWKAEKSLADALKSAWEWEKNYRNKK